MNLLWKPNQRVHKVLKVYAFYSSGKSYFKKKNPSTFDDDKFAFNQAPEIYHYHLTNKTFDEETSNFDMVILPKNLKQTKHKIRTKSPYKMDFFDETNREFLELEHHKMYLWAMTNKVPIFYTTKKVHLETIIENYIDRKVYELIPSFDRIKNDFTKYQILTTTGSSPFFVTKQVVAPYRYGYVVVDKRTKKVILQTNETKLGPVLEEKLLKTLIFHYNWFDHRVFEQIIRSHFTSKPLQFFSLRF